MMAAKTCPPASNLRMTVSSNSRHSESAAETKQETEADQNDRKENDSIEMGQILQGVIEPKNNNNNATIKTHIEVTIPNKRLRQNRHSRPGKGSMMGSQNIMGSAVITLKIPELIDEDSTTNATNEGAVDSDDIADDAVNEIIEILKKDINDRVKHEIDILIAYFEQFEIISDDVIYSGHHTFRALIQKTKYLYVRNNENIGDANNDSLCFYFVLFGRIGEHAKNQAFGENEMYNLDKSINNSVCGHISGVHLAYWDIDAYDSYIRPVRELNTNIASEQQLLHDKYGNLLTENDLIEKASMFLDDAIHGRDFKMHRNGKLPKKVHKFLNTKWVRYFLICTCLLWLFFIQFEPSSTIFDTDPKTTQYEYIRTLIICEWFIFIILFIECSLRFYSFGRKWFFKDHLLHKVRVVLLFILFTDLLIASIRKGHSFSMRRILRPFFLMLFIRDLRIKYFILFNTLPSIIEIIMLYLALTGIFARIGYHIFQYTSDVYSKEDFFVGAGTYEKYLQNQVVPETALEGEYIWYSFHTFYLSSMSLFVLLTAENFPELLWPAWLSNHVYYSYFLVYILISTFFLMNLFSASVYNAYLMNIGKIDVYDEHRELIALNVAWNCLDYDEKGYFEFDRFSRLIRKLKPKYNTFEINVLFQLMDPNQNGKIEKDEFNDMMINCLYFSISKRTNSREDELKLYLQSLGQKLGSKYGYDILSVFTSAYYRNFILFIISIDVCSLLTYHYVPTLCTYTDGICIILILISTFIDIIIFKFDRYFETSTNKIYFVITMIQSLGTIVGIASLPKDDNYLSGLRFIGISRILVMASFLRQRFSFLKSSVSNTLTQTVIYMIPVFLRICFYLFVGLLYIFTVVGMELFYDWHDESQWGQIRCNGLKQLEQNTYALFCDANATMITLFQILTTNNWHIIMYQAIEITDSYFVSIYFLLFFIAGPILVVNYLLAVFFDMFFAASQEEINKQDVLLQQIDQLEQNKFDQQQQLLFNNFSSAENSQIEAKECGISALSDGTKILSIEKKSVNIQSLADIEYMQSDNLIHITLINVAKSLFFNVPLSSYTDSNGDVWNDTFNGETATKCFLSLKYASDHEDAIDYLSQIMDAEAAFSRINITEQKDENNDSNSFLNDKNAYYQWNIVFSNKITKQISIGVRHSYGGFQRLMKHNRRTGAINSAQTNNNQPANDENIPSQIPQNTIATPKANIFSTRNVLNFQNMNGNQVKNSNQAQKNSNNQIKNGLVILIGNAEEKDMEEITAKYVDTFEKNYNFTVIHSNSDNLTLSKYFNVDKYDSIIIILHKYITNSRMEDIYNIFTKKLRLKHFEIPKLIICINDEFEEEQDNEDADEDADYDEMYELFGVIETNDTQFSNCFLNALDENYKNEKRISLITLVNKVSGLISNNIYLNRFDPRLLIYELMPNK